VSTSTFTLEPESRLPRGPNGRKCCRQCGTETKPPARTFCSQACVDKWKEARPSPSEARTRVLARDRGVCAICRRDTEADRYRLEGMLLVLAEIFLRPFAASWTRFGSVNEAVYSVPLHSRLGRYWSARHDVAYAAEEAERFGRPVFCPIEYAPFLRFCRDLKLSKPYGGQPLWEADHIVPVVEGGGECGIDNYRTLCIACHRAETAKLAARRAEKRRADKVSA